MSSLSKVAIIDKDIRRRAAMSYLLSRVVSHVEPCECLDDLDRLTLESLDYVFVSDADDTLHTAIVMAEEEGHFSVIAYGEAPCHEQIVSAMRAGAVDYLKWPFTEESIADRIVDANGYRSTLSALRIRQSRARSRMSRLTPRETEVLHHVAQGLSSKEIGRSLGLSPRTVEIHRASMLTKVNSRSTSEAVRIALESSLLNDDGPLPAAIEAETNEDPLVAA